MLQTSYALSRDIQNVYSNHCTRLQLQNLYHSRLWKTRLLSSNEILMHSIVQLHFLGFLVTARNSRGRENNVTGGCLYRKYFLSFRSPCTSNDSIERQSNYSNQVGFLPVHMHLTETAAILP